MMILLAITIFIFGILSLMQKTPARRFVGYVIVITEVLHYVLFNELDGLMYYGSAALFDLLAIILIVNLAIPSALAKQMLYISGVSIVFNYIGWSLWLTYMPPTIYNWSFIVLNLCTIICLIKREPGHGRHTGNNSCNPIVYRDSYSGSKSIIEL